MQAQKKQLLGPMILVDAHCHLTHLSSTELAIVLNQAAPVKLKTNDDHNQFQSIKIIYILGGTDPQDWILQTELAKQYPFQVIPSFGLHPWWVTQTEQEKSLEQALDQLENQFINQTSLIGEIGLDFIKAQTQKEKDKQIYYFKQQLNLAEKYNKSVCLHIVKAHNEALNIFKNKINLANSKGSSDPTESSALSRSAHAKNNSTLINKSAATLRTPPNRPITGFIHGFNSSIEIANQWIGLNVFLSFGPSICKAQNKKIINLLKKIDTSFLLTETDISKTYDLSNNVLSNNDLSDNMLSDSEISKHKISKHSDISKFSHHTIYDVTQCLAQHTNQSFTDTAQTNLTNLETILKRSLS